MAHIPLRLILDGDALAANWRWLAARSGGAACGAAVKADGYGLGAQEVVQRLAAAGCRDFFVATWAEAEALAPWPEELALSVLHGAGADDMATALASPARPVLSTPDQVSRWRETGRPADVMVDTGINRLGLTPEQALSGLLDGVKIETLMSHLACADEPDHPMNERQLSLFRSLRQDVKAERYSLANSAGICLGPKYCFGLTRPGLALYGGIPVPGKSEQESALRPVVSMEARIIQIRAIEDGCTVGYGATYAARGPMQVAILNIGYADGFLRQLGAEGYAQAGEHLFPIIGLISMDLMAVNIMQSDRIDTVDVAKGERHSRSLEPARLREGDWLTLDYSLPRIAAASPLTQYELLTNLGSRFERVWR